MRALPIPIAALTLILATQAAALGQGLTGTTQVPPGGTQSVYGLRPYAYYVPNPAYYSYHASTAAEGFARGQAAVISAWGQYNQLSAQARLIHAEAYREEIANRELATQAYFALRRENVAARAAERGPRLTQSQLVELAAKARPDRLSPCELSTAGEILWPTVLRADEFATQRVELENVFAQRAAEGEIGLDQRQQVGQTTEAMLDLLKTFIKSVDSGDYIAARNFIKSLAYEAILPLS